MADIHIQRKHALGLPEARKIALQWAELVEEKFDLVCSHEKGLDSDQLSFTRSGVNGTLTVTADSFELIARLGFLLSVFKEEIEGRIANNLDELMLQAGTAPAVAASRKPKQNTG